MQRHPMLRGRKPSRLERPGPAEDSRATGRLLAVAAILSSLSAFGLFVAIERPFDAPSAAVARVEASRHDGMIALAPAMNAESLTFAHNQPLASDLVPPENLVDDPVQAAAVEATVAPIEAEETLRTAQGVHPLVAPLPMARPADLGALTRAEPSRQPQTKTAAVPPPAENPTFLEKLFGLKPGQGGAGKPSGLGALLGFAALPGDPPKDDPTTRISPSLGNPEIATAVYDITAKTVYMPNGEKMEAHSGLGEYMDDPRYVHVRMKGATPPGIYNLTEREALFHGVRALRMHPVGGSAAIHGRAGILTHSYLLGPNGDSNGCISFKDYDRFLQAYLKGDVKRIVVVARGGEDLLPAIARAKGDLRSVVALNAR